MTDAPKPKVALWFRYGPAEHAELFHAIPEIVERLAEHCDVHFFGLRSRRIVPRRIEDNATIHHLPLTVNRTRTGDKMLKTLAWIFFIPYIGLRCRFMGVRAVYIDETIPLTAFLARMFFGRRVAFTVADFFTDIYLGKHLLLRPLGWMIRSIDMASWRRLPLIFTRAKSTRRFLADRGVSENRVHPVYDPCDRSIYHPADKAAAKARFGFTKDDMVLVHHGILHPNKGNHRIIKALATLKHECPNLRYLLVGDGPDMARLNELTRELNLDEVVTFTGWLPTLEDVNDALNAGDIGLVMRVGHPSDHFHMTGALVHSMACGLPVIAAKLAGVSEVIVDGENGFLFDPANMDEFREKLKQLIRDEELRKRFGKSVLQSAVDLFDMERVVDDTVRPLLDLVFEGLDRPAKEAH